MAAKTLSYYYKTSNVLIKLIAINAAIFIMVGLLTFILQNDTLLTKYFVLPAQFSQLILQPWSLITYSFLHSGIFHVLFNMLWLYWFGNIVLNLFNEKRLLTIYLLGAIFGGLLFVLSYNFFPVFSQKQGYLVGASGAVTAVMIFIATYAPQTAIRIFTFTIKLWQLALFLFVLDLVRIPTSGNAGGLLAHVGGGIFGYIYATQLEKGKDIGKWFENSMDWFASLFKTKNKKPFKKVHRTTQAAPKRTVDNESKTEHQKKVDSILDKIGKSGYESLTKAEKDFLFKAGKED